MAKTLSLLGFLVLLAGCSSAPPRVDPTTAACAAGEATYACQVQRYHDVAL